MNPLRDCARTRAYMSTSILTFTGPEVEIILYAQWRPPVKYGRKSHRISFISQRTFTAAKTGSCHHRKARPLGLRMGSRPPGMQVSCEYTEYTVVDSRLGVVLQPEGLA